MTINLIAMTKTRAELIAELERFNSACVPLALQIIRSQEKDIKLLREKLSFYSSPSDYVAPYTGGLGKLYFDCGDNAKEALALTSPDKIGE